LYILNRKYATQVYLSTGLVYLTCCRCTDGRGWHQETVC